MTENEAINNLACMRKNIKNTNNLETTKEIIHNTITSAIAALEEVQQYRAIGTVEECQKAIEEQPKIGEWIPCSECLPDHEGQVLVQVSGKFRNIILDNAFELAEYDKNEGWILEIFPKWENPDVIAWQPLPEPYKTGE